MAVHDERLVGMLLGDETAPVRTRALTKRSEGLVRLAATIALDAAPSSIQHAVAHALAAGATNTASVAMLEAVIIGDLHRRVVLCAPKIGLALGYDVEAALE